MSAQLLISKNFVLHITNEKTEPRSSFVLMPVSGLCNENVHELKQVNYMYMYNDKDVTSCFRRETD